MSMSWMKRRRFEGKRSQSRRGGPCAGHESRFPEALTGPSPNTSRKCQSCDGGRGSEGVCDAVKGARGRRITDSIRLNTTVQGASAQVNPIHETLPCRLRDHPLSRDLGGQCVSVLGRCRREQEGSLWSGV